MMRDILAEGECVRCHHPMDYDWKRGLWVDLDGAVFCPVESGGGLHEAKEDE